MPGVITLTIKVITLTLKVITPFMRMKPEMCERM